MRQDPLTYRLFSRVLALSVVIALGLTSKTVAQMSNPADSSWTSFEKRLFELELATVTGESSGTIKRDAMRSVRTIESKEIVTMGAHSLRDLMRSQLNFEVAQDLSLIHI